MPPGSCKKDTSRLRVFFGPVCKALELRPPGPQIHGPGVKPCFDKYAGRHVQARLLEQVTPEMINRFLSERVQEDGWSARTVNHTRQILHRLFAYATKHLGFRAPDRRYPNPAAAVERRPEPAPEIRFPSLQQVAGQLEALEGDRATRAAVAIYIYAGLRRVEALWLTREDVDLPKRLIRVRAKTVSAERWQPKTRRNRVVPISTDLVRILLKYAPPGRSVWYAVLKNPRRECFTYSLLFPTARIIAALRSGGVGRRLRLPRLSRAERAAGPLQPHCRRSRPDTYGDQLMASALFGWAAESRCCVTLPAGFLAARP
ncbi:MAG: hypothetical protein AMK72_00385 [Planctomycetes bacterium SM23_25]|nr:MAG: hypothetical protein AMK72_00385 [Planctomycetes bacterium SM23_25]